jgi:hypothetical protein
MKTPQSTQQGVLPCSIFSYFTISRKPFVQKEGSINRIWILFFRQVSSRLLLLQRAVPVPRPQLVLLLPAQKGGRRQQVPLQARIPRFQGCYRGRQDLALRNRCGQCFILKFYFSSWIQSRGFRERAVQADLAFVRNSTRDYLAELQKKYSWDLPMRIFISTFDVFMLLQLWFLSPWQKVKFESVLQIQLKKPLGNLRWFVDIADWMGATTTTCAQVPR